MRDLLTDPLWQAEDIGRPLPDSPHACSVCLPTWQSVVGYEEDDPAVTSRMQAGYPRFFCHPLVTAVFARAVKELGQPGMHGALVWPTEQAAEGFEQFMRRKGIDKVATGNVAGFRAVLFPKEQEKTARLYWRYCGQGVSSRLAAAILDGWTPHDFQEAEVTGAPARDALKQRLADLSGQPINNVFLFGSGMAGVVAVHRALTARHPGRRTVQLGFPYVDALKVQEEFGSGVCFLPGSLLPSWRGWRKLQPARRWRAFFASYPAIHSSNARTCASWEE